MRVLLFLCLWVVATQAALEDFFLVRNSVIQAQNDLGRVNDADAEDCALKCLELENCHSFEFKPEHRKCDLSSARIEDNHLIRSPYGWEMYAMFPNKAKMAKLTATIEAHKTETEGLQESIAAIRANIERTERLLENSTKKVENMMTERDSMAQETDTLVALLQSTNESLSEVMASYSSLQQSEQELREILATHTTQISTLEQSSTDFTKSLGDKEKMVTRLYSEKAAVEGQLAHSRGLLATLQTRIIHLNARVKSLEVELDEADDPEVYVARDCAELYTKHDVRDSGVYDIYPFGNKGKRAKAHCYMGDGGGWTVIQHRDTLKGCAFNFHRTWAEYKNGFGTAGQEYWLGNDAISALSNAERTELKVVVKDGAGQYKYSTYRDFKMGSEREQYKLKSITYRTGNSGDQLSYLRNYNFGTRDRENNNARCSTASNGAFWFKTTRYCSKKSWWSCSRYSYSCSITNINAKTARWNQYTTWSVIRIRPQRLA